MTKECLVCKWRKRVDMPKPFSFLCVNRKSDYYNTQIPLNPSFTYCIAFETK